MNRSNYLTSEFLTNFPFPSLRENQIRVLNEIDEALNSDYKIILLEAPTGFGKSPVAVSVAMTLGTSYICTSTKDLQSQYARDFPFIKVAKGMNNFPCLVKEDFIRNGSYHCGSCFSSYNIKNEYCPHTTVDFGPCLIDVNFNENSGPCRHRTGSDAYKIVNRGTKDEQIFITSKAREEYQNQYSEWSHTKNLEDNRNEWIPCGYYDQLNIALMSTHSIFNYAMFLRLLSYEGMICPRQLLVLDEGHLLEMEIMKSLEFSISKKHWKRHLDDFSIINYGYDDIEKWIDFLIELEAKMLASLGDLSAIKQLVIRRQIKCNWNSSNIIKTIPKQKAANTKITDYTEGNSSKSSCDNSSTHTINNDYKSEMKFEIDDRIIDYLAPKISKEPIEESQARKDTNLLSAKIDAILSDPNNWIVYDIKNDGHGVASVEFKPINTSSYCKSVFDKCSNTLIMSATILNHTAFCKSVGLNPADIKFIQVSSDFPIENRRIYPLNLGYLNYYSLQSQCMKSKIVKAIDDIMSFHRNTKGIINTTSYNQLNFIKENISKQNAQRLVETNPNLDRDEVIARHTISSDPTVLISPSLYTGIDLKDDLSRFQVIVKVPYPDLTDRWINAKMQNDKGWYYWQTALRLVQAYGRSVRSNQDWAKTYILDSAFVGFLKDHRNMFPHWFTSAIVSLNTIHIHRPVERIIF